MTYSDSLALILNTITSFGGYVLTIITAVIVVGLAYLVFRFGLYKIFYDKSFMVGGFYLRNTPYKGYNRWRSKNWNLKNTM